MDIISEKGCFNSGRVGQRYIQLSPLWPGNATSLPSKHGVENNTQGQQETGRFGRHAREGRHDGRTAHHEHQGNQYVREQAKADENAVSDLACTVVSG